jgi:hypothetical protein
VFDVYKTGLCSTNKTIVVRALESISLALVLVLLVTIKVLIKALSINRDKVFSF